MIARVRGFVQRFLGIKFVQDTITLQAGKMVLTAISVGSGIILLRGLGKDEYGIWSTMLTLYGLLLFFNLTGVDQSTLTRLSESLSAGNRTLTRDLMAFYLQVAVVVSVIFSTVAFLVGPSIAQSSYNSRAVGELMAVYTLVYLPLSIYQLMLLVLQSRRSMRAYTLLENGGVVIDAALVVVVVVTQTGAAGLVVAYLCSALIKAVGSVWAYRDLQRRRPETLPDIGEILTGARHNSPRPYWRFGFTLAIDKNLASLFILLPQQLVGMAHGPAAVGFLKLALSALNKPAVIFTGVLTNLAARIPADVGRGEYSRLQFNLKRVGLVVIPGVLVIFGAFAVLAPLAVPILIGEEYTPVIPLIRVLCIYAVITGVGGMFGPLYRSLRLMRPILVSKVAALALAALPALWLITQPFEALIGAETINRLSHALHVLPPLWLADNFAALGGAWAITLVYAISVGLTIAITWPVVRRRARAEKEAGR